MTSTLSTWVVLGAYLSYGGRLWEIEDIYGEDGKVRVAVRNCAIPIDQCTGNYGRAAYSLEYILEHFKPVREDV